ncbi:hypothetical protein JCM9140_2383 [Halalkalibacter wakoensis JCM 9140]|uniref:Ferric siderophore reductase C-terminal domain-containing protein n=1 Tax=Halalkalibacter wakoensis JCM 9140 TaxID=1236970 RepID=W4Q2W6_9BACI|nr:hypothetical protein [Halalkalibacter wakoensis]GAE26332.1 hypothetical protein JCM9140_2383 [Halalkalibacter wakoensis JCM 9140]
MNLILEELSNQFSIELVYHSSNVKGVPISDMTNTEKVQLIVQNRTNCFQATDYRVGGANVMKWFGSLISAHLYTYFVHNRWLKAERVHFIENGKEAYFQILQPELASIDNQADDHDLILSHFFADLKPVFERVAESSGLSIQHIWGLVANAYYNRLEAWVALNERSVLEKHDSLKHLTPEVFNLKRNPFLLTFRYVESWKDPASQIKIKGTCCLSYLKGEGTYCYSCPKLTKEQRKNKGEQLRSCQ